MGRSSAGRATVFGIVGRRFESCRPSHYLIKPLVIKDHYILLHITPCIKYIDLHYQTQRYTMIVIILPPAFCFSAKKPHSIETVLRTNNSQSKYKSQITVICDQGADSGNDYKTIKIPQYQSKSERTNMILSIIKQLNPAIIEMHQDALCGFKIASEFTEIPVIFYRHNVIEKTGNILTRWHYKRRYSAFAACVFVSQFLADRFNKAFPEFAKSCFAVPNAIDVNDWTINSIEKENLIVFAGRAISEKGIEPLAQALEIVLKQKPNWSASLAMSHWDSNSDWAEKITKGLKNFDNRCKIYKNAPIDNVKTLLAKGKIAVIPSICEESFCLSAIEAHAAKCAVISSGTGGLKEASGENALYLESVNANNIATAILKLIDDEELLQHLATNGYHFARENHNVKLRATQLDLIRDSIIKTKI